MECSLLFHYYHTQEGAQHTALVPTISKVPCLLLTFQLLSVNIQCHTAFTSHNSIPICSDISRNNWDTRQRCHQGRRGLQPNP